jgi:hypothetical protein
LGVGIVEQDPVDVLRRELVAEFGGQLSDDTIEMLAAQEVAVFDDASVRDFVVLLAGRRARARASALIKPQPVA